MPSKNILKDYVDNAYYHIYNRGVAKQNIFIDKIDYKKFLSYLKLYLTPLDKSLKVAPSKSLKNYSEQIKLLAYCLMPNHFHLFIYQKDNRSIINFMRSLGTKYSMYFNRRYKRVGPVFQGRYKAVMVDNEYQFVYLSKYIHRNPIDILPARTDPAGYKYSSYGNYLGLFKQSWVDTSEILSYFNQSGLNETYKKFVEEIDERDLYVIKKVVIDL
ncbi:MAG: transposase [Patescibacteria group bacterium]|nr:transposase [Patescibacteria group bacterium]